MAEQINFRLALNVKHTDCHKAADAFWAYWKANGETHRHGYYESTWGAINQAIKLVGVVPHGYGLQAAGQAEQPQEALTVPAGHKVAPLNGQSSEVSDA